jgi:Flp pilus assembly protein TadD
VKARAHFVSASRAAFLACMCACGGELRSPSQLPIVAAKTTLPGTIVDAGIVPEQAVATIQIAPPSSTKAPSEGELAARTPANARALPRYSFPLPLAKPTTIALSTGGVDAADSALAAGDTAFEAGTIAVAQSHYLKARAAAPKRAAPVVGVARVRIARVGAPLDYGSAKGNSEIASVVKELRRAIAMEPQLGVAHVELGRAFLLLGDGVSALDALRKGAELMPSEAEAHSAYGVALLATGNGDEALAALLLLMRGRVADAVTEYELQLTLAPDDAMAHADLGAALLHSGARVDVDRGTRELEIAVKRDPKRASFHSNLGYALQLQSKVSEAVVQYREALRLDSTFAGAWINLATALARDPKTRPEARSALERARALDATDPRVNANLDELDELEGRPARATPRSNMSSDTKSSGSSKKK